MLVGSQPSRSDAKGAAGGRAGLASLSQGAECAGEEDEWVFEGRGAHVVDAAYDDPVITGGVLGDDLTLERGEGVSEQRHAAASESPVETHESIRAGGGRARRDCSCCRPSMFTPKRPARRMRDQLSELRDGQNETSGGSSETEVDEFTIRAGVSPSGAAVTNATPVADLPSASRNERASGAGAGRA